MSENHKHFEGKKVSDHLRAARLKGARATAEIHGAEASGFLAAFTDSLKETAVLFLALWILLAPHLLSEVKIVGMLSLFSIGWLLWKIGRSSLLGWSRLERLHRLIEEEKWEIEHHRGQEKEELTAMYREKGLSGALLEQVIEVLMADDNRLLRVMLEEELGLTLESYEHPLEQGGGAGLGVIGALLGLLAGFFIGGFLGASIALSLLFLGVTFWASKKEGNEWPKSMVWNGAVAILALGSLHFIARWMYHVFS